MHFLNSYHRNLTNLKTLLPFMVAILLSFLPSLYSADYSKDFDTANRAYSEGKFSDAASAYEKIITDRGYSAPVLFNLGNAYAHLGKPGLAILCYERAERLSPRDADIQKNLLQVRNEAGVPLPVHEWWRSLLHFFRPEEWSLMASIVFSLFCLLSALRFWKPQSLQAIGITPSFEIRAWRLLLTFLGLTSFLLAAFFALSMQYRNQAVVIEKQAQVLISPYEKADLVESLPEGEIVNAEKKHDHFLFVRYRKGQGGWIDEKQIELVEPITEKD